MAAEMTLYRLIAAPELGPFETATEAVLAAFAARVSAAWEAFKRAAPAGSRR